MAARRITIVGGGVGGYPAAIRAARLGASVTLVEKADLGGTCLNLGCIPTKSLLRSVEVFKLIKESHLFGIKVGQPEIDFTAVMKRKDQVVARLRKGVGALVAAKKVNVIKGTAEVLDPKTIRIADTGEKVEGDALILATGSAPAIPPIPGLDKADPWNSNDFLAMEKLPPTAAVIGGGVVGLEVAQVLVGLGTRVTVLEMMPQLIPGVDREVAQSLEKALSDQGIDIVVAAEITEVTSDDEKHVLSYTVNGEKRTLDIDRIIVAVGRVPVTNGLNAGKLGMAVSKGAIQVNERMETNVPGVYAVGDVTGGVMLAHVAVAEGECAAVNAVGGQASMHYRAVPSCIYTTPEVAVVGLSEEQAKQNHEVQVGRFPFTGCGKAVVIDQTYGMVKIIADKKYSEVLGVHIIGPHATDLIAEAVLGMTMEATVQELADAIHPHPTVSEAVMEAALCLTGGPIHMP